MKETKIKNQLQYQSYYKLLVAEDSIDVQQIIEEYLQGLPVKIDFANNGFEALKKYRENHYNLILMDLNMPVLNGIETIKLLNKHVEKQTPILMISGDVSEDSVESLNALGIFKFLIKPFDSKTLINAVTKYSFFQKTDKKPEDSFDISDLIPQFIANRRIDYTKLMTFLQKGHYESVSRICHTIKSSSKMYGFPSLGNIAQELEVTANAKNHRACMAQLHNFKQELFFMINEMGTDELVLQ